MFRSLTGAGYCDSATFLTSKAIIMKTYTVTVNNGKEGVMDSFEINANGIRDAEKKAQFHKRMEKIKGILTVRIKR